MKRRKNRSTVCLLHRTTSSSSVSEPLLVQIDLRKSGLQSRKEHWKRVNLISSLLNSTVSKTNQPNTHTRCASQNKCVEQ